jgi:hypothetical protein
MICLSKSVKPCFVDQDTAEKETGWRYLHIRQRMSFFIIVVAIEKKTKSFKTFKNNFLIL